MNSGSARNKRQSPSSTPIHTEAGQQMMQIGQRRHAYPRRAEPRPRAGRRVEHPTGYNGDDARGDFDVDDLAVRPSPASSARSVRAAAPVMPLTTVPSTGTPKARSTPYDATWPSGNLELRLLRPAVSPAPATSHVRHDGWRSARSYDHSLERRRGQSQALPCATSLLARTRDGSRSYAARRSD